MSEAAQSPELPVKEGDVLAGKYAVEKVLGVGGMGVVVSAMHLELDERVALKFLLPSVAKNPQVVARFSREARAAAKIKSQHVARVTDVGTLDDGLPYIVMEYLEGGDLSAMLMEKGRLSYGTAVDHVLQAIEALAEAHAAGFVHRDLKPGNLFLAVQADGHPIIKVLDFGISKAVLSDVPENEKSLTRTSEIFGSPMYMSPEQLKSSRDVDPRADVWALGVILYELIVGKSPFDRPTVAETFGAILYEKPEPMRKHVPDLPEDLDRAVLMCLEKDKEARVANVAELAKLLVPFAATATRATIDRTARVLRKAGVSVASVPPGPLNGKVNAQTNVPPGAQTRTAWDAQPVPRPPRGRTALYAVIGLAVAGVAGVFGFLRSHRQLPTTPAVQPDKPVVTAPVSAAPPVTTPSSVQSAAMAALTAPTATPTVTPKASASAPVVEPPQPTSRPKTTGKTTKTAPTSGAQTSSPVAPPPPPTPKHSEDPDGFGDRK